MDKELIELTKKEITRLIHKPSKEWTQQDVNSIYYLLGVLFGKLNEIENKP